MGNLFASLGSAGATLQAIQKSLAVVQNNVANASTPGYAKQRIRLESLPFDADAGLSGGMAARELISFRSEYLETAVQQQNQRQGRFSQQVMDLSQVEPVFDIGSQSGIAFAVDQAFQAISQWSVTPNDAVARQTVISRADAMARTFQNASTSLSRVLNGSRSQIGDTVESINQLAGRVAAYNTAVRADFRAQSDPGLAAEVDTIIEELSGLVDVTVVRQQGGGLMVLAGGQIPLVLGDKVNALSAGRVGEQAVIRDANGADVSGLIQDGRLRAHLDTQNITIPSLAADLNLLAQSVADSVNTALAAGVDQNGLPGAPLFTYNAAGAASTISITAIQPAELAGALPGAPGGNGNVLALAGLAGAPLINGTTFSGFYGATAARAGRLLDGARLDERTQSLLLLQARSLRAEESSVSLDEEAVHMVELQRHYQAAAQLFQTINQMTEELLNIMR